MIAQAHIESGTPGLKQSGQRCESKASSVDLGEYADTRQGPHDSGEGLRMRPGGFREFLATLRAFLQEVDDAELGDDVNRLRDPVAGRMGD
jgi:hypothetical protein